MNLSQLRAVVAIYEEGQFTRAADRLGIAQSSLSAQVRGLEKEIGLPLFDRTTRHVVATDAGAFLVDRAFLILAQVDDTAQELTRMRGVLSGQVTIGLTQTPGPVDVIQLLRDFHAAHPQVELSVREDLSVDLAEQLREDRIDIGILTIVEPSDLRGLGIQELASEDLVVIIPPGHSLAKRTAISIADLRTESFVVSPNRATIRSAMAAAAAAAGFEPRVAFVSREVGRIRGIVAAGLGVALLPRSDAVSPGPVVTVLELRSPRLTHRLSLCWRRSRKHPPAARALLAAARTSLVSAS